MNLTTYLLRRSTVKVRLALQELLEDGYELPQEPTVYCSIDVMIERVAELTCCLHLLFDV